MCPPSTPTSGLLAKLALRRIEHDRVASSLWLPRADARNALSDTLFARLQAAFTAGHGAMRAVALGDENARLGAVLELASASCLRRGPARRVPRSARRPTRRLRLPPRPVCPVDPALNARPPNGRTPSQTPWRAERAPHHTAH